MSFQLTLIIHVMLSLALVTLILIQHGKGADAGAGFGAGSSGSVFGARGSDSFIYKLTFNIAIGFFVTSFYLAYLSSPEKTATPKSIMEQSVSTPFNDIPLIAPSTTLEK